jgi:pimeloyl-ACP methyl ester carboxylesterase
MSQNAAARLPPVSSRVEEGFLPVPGGGSLAFRAEGEGPALILCNGLGVSTFFWHHVVSAFAGRHQVVTWDYRGHGRSGKAPREGFTIRTCAEDLLRLMDRLGIEKAVLMGHSLGSQVILEACRLAPERVLGLVPTLGGYGRTVETFFHSRHSVRALQLLEAVANVRPSLSQRVVKTFAQLPGAVRFAKLAGLVSKDLCPPEEMAPYLAHLATLDLNVYFQLANDLQAHDATDLLPQLKVPVLVFGADRDLFTPLFVSERMTALIPGAELCVLRGGSHAALVEQPQLLCLRLERFLVDRLGTPPMTHMPGA